MTFIRASLALALALAATGAIQAADASGTAGAVAPAKVVNTVCPNSGDPVDPAIAPTTVTTKDGKTVVIGTCCAKCAAIVAKDPDKFAAAAEKNEKAK